MADAGLLEPVVWLVRRCELRIATLPAMGERISVRDLLLRHRPALGRAHDDAGPPGRSAARPGDRRAGRPSAGPTAGRCRYRRTSGDLRASAGGRVVSARLSHPRPGGADFVGNGAAGARRRVTGRCGRSTSIPPATSTTPCTGRSWRTNWRPSAGCRHSLRSSTTARSCPAACRGWSPTGRPARRCCGCWTGTSAARLGPAGHGSSRSWPRERPRRPGATSLGPGRCARADRTWQRARPPESAVCRAIVQPQRSDVCTAPARRHRAGQDDRRPRLRERGGDR